MEQQHTMFDESGVLAAVLTEVQQRFSTMHDLAHGWEHVHRVYTLALSLAEQERGNRFIVGMAALMHDLGRAAPQGETRHHAHTSVALATTIMQTHEVPKEYQDAILHAIIAHSFSLGVQPETLEARIVRDADRLDGLGAIGILRWAMTGVVRHTAYTYHPQDPFGAQHTLDDRQYMLDHFFTKLLTLEETMQTSTGRSLARQRTGFMRDYLAQLQRELELS